MANIPKPSIYDVKNTYELSWMQIEGVEGVGISEKNGQEYIVVYVSQKAPAQTTIPSNVEGYPVKIIHTGPFRAF